MSDGHQELIKDIFSTSTVKEIQSKNEKLAKSQKQKEKGK